MPATAPPSPQTPIIAFTGDRRELFRIILSNMLLNLLTLGVYRFWAITRLRRFYWHNISIDGDNLEYNGVATQLLFGAVIVFAFILIIFLALDISIDITFAGLTSVLFVLYPFAIFRARRYRLAHTCWRGIRFTQNGNQWLYTIKFILYGLLLSLTFGLTYPLLRAHRHGGLLKDMSFGNQPAKFRGRVGDIMRPWLASIAMGLTLGIILIVTANSGNSLASAALIFLILFCVPILLVIFTYYQIHEFQFFIRYLKIGPHRFRSQLNREKIIKIYLRYLAILSFLQIAAAVIFVFLATFISMIFTESQIGNTLENLNEFFDFSNNIALGAMGVFVLLFALPLRTVTRHLFWITPLLAYGAQKISISNFEQVEQIRQAEDDDNLKHGEGLAALLDVDAGF